MQPTPDVNLDFEQDGFVYLPGFLSPAEIADVRRWTDELVAMPEVPGRHMVYYEDSLAAPGERLLSRIENFCPFHPGFDRLLRRGSVSDCVADLLGEPVVLFKEKINFKLPGADGFKAHQDVQAGWEEFAPLHVTALISIDATTRENGWLELAPGHGGRRRVGEMWRPLEDSEVPDAAYRPYPTAPGDALLFDSFVPHRSGPNRTGHARRVLYVTYNRLADGDHRVRYYAAKRASYPPDCERDPGTAYRFRV